MIARFLIISLGVLCLANAPAFGGALSPPERNLMVACEAGATTAVMLTWLEPCSACLSFSGSFSDSGWTTRIDGFYSCYHVDFLHCGACEPGGVSGASTMSGEGYGGYWSGAGRWDSEATSDSTEKTSWECSAVYDAPWDVLTFERYSIAPLETVRRAGAAATTISGWGTYERVWDGVPAGLELLEWVEISVPEASPGTATVILILQDEEVFLSAAVNLTKGTFAGTAGLFGPSSAERVTWGYVKALYR